MRAVAGGVRGGGGGAAAAGAGGKGGAWSRQSHRTLSCPNSRVQQFEHTMVFVGQELQGLIVFDGASQCTQARAGGGGGAGAGAGAASGVVWRDVVLQVGATEGACAGAGARAIVGRVRGAGGVGAGAASGAVWRDVVVQVGATGVGTGGQASQGTAAAGSRAGNSTFAGKACAGRLHKVDADAVESGPARTGVSQAITGEGTGDGGIP